LRYLITFGRLASHYPIPNSTRRCQSHRFCASTKSRRADIAYEAARYAKSKAKDEIIEVVDLSTGAQVIMLTDGRASAGSVSWQLQPASGADDIVGLDTQS
jgi:hypothetical protein